MVSNTLWMASELGQKIKSGFARDEIIISSLCRDRSQVAEGLPGS